MWSEAEFVHTHNLAGGTGLGQEKMGKMFMDRIKYSLLIARYALLPAAGRGEAACEPKDGAFIVTATAVAACLSDLERLVDDQGELSLFFPGCFALVAPFLLFRLKREGFSRCRVFTQNGGLVLRARR